MTEVIGTYEWKDGNVLHQLAVYETGRGGFEIWSGRTVGDVVFAKSPGNLPPELPDHASAWLGRRLVEATSADPDEEGGQ